jgi:hypothetical protein
MHDSPHLRMIIKYILDPKVVWWKMLVGVSYTKSPRYKPNKYMDAEGRLFSDLRLIYMFVESGDENWGMPPGRALSQDQLLTRMAMQNNPRKRERKWCELLETITPDDAELLGNAANKAFPFEGLPREVIDTAFPGLLDPVPARVVAPVEPVQLTLDDIL